MKNLSFCLFSGLLFFGLTVKAQDFAIGVKAGASIPNLTAAGGNQTPVNTGYSSRLGADASVFAEFKFSDLFSLQPMVEYSSQGGKKDGLQAIVTPGAIAAMYPAGQAPQYLYANYNSVARLNYLMVPILAKFGWNLKKSPLRFYVDAGPFVSFLLSAHQVTSGESQFYTDAAGQQPFPGGQQSFNATTDLKNQLHTVNMGAEANVGLSYKMGLGSVFIEGGGNFGFINIQKVTQDGKNDTGAATVVVGYSYWFGK